MKENNNGNDTNVGSIGNSIEEDIARISKLLTTKFNNDYSIDNKDKEALEHILSDYKLLQEDFQQVDHECSRLEQKEIKLEKENAQLKEDIKEMYYKEAVITIICDNFNLSRNEVLELLGDEE